MVDKIQLNEKLTEIGFSSFEDIVCEYQHSVFSTAYSFTNDMCDAEDLAQEVFLLIYRNFMSFNNDSKLSTWIYRITINKCLSYRRNIARRKSIVQMIPMDNADTNKIKDNENVEKSVLKHENDDILRSEIYSMGDDYSVIIHLKYYESLGNKEIAEILGLPLRTVETRIYRAKKRLRKRLEKTNYRWETI